MTAGSESDNHQRCGSAVGGVGGFKHHLLYRSYDVGVVVLVGPFSCADGPFVRCRSLASFDGQRILGTCRCETWYDTIQVSFLRGRFDAQKVTYGTARYFRPDRGPVVGWFGGWMW